MASSRNFEYRPAVSSSESNQDKKPETVAEQVALALVKKAVKGDVRAIVEATDRTEGRVPQGHELSGPGGTQLEGDALEERVAALWAKAAKKPGGREPK